MRPLIANPATNEAGGAWQVFVYANERSATDRFSPTTDLTFFRGVPTEVLSIGTSDPFGPSSATLKFPRITYFDRMGTGDLWWCTPESSVDICWVVGDEVVYAWEGFFTSFEYGEAAAGSELTITCQGALLQLDHYLAKPEYTYQPIPFERAIARQMENRPDLRLGPLWIDWPPWWTLVYKPDPANVRRPWMQPVGVAVGNRWTGMVTRDTGTWSQVLTGYIQTLLQSMQTDRGQFTMLLDRYRQPVLTHRDRLYVPNDSTLIVDLLHPGVALSLVEDHSQKLNTVFVTGQSRSGSKFTGMTVSNDGRTVAYRPFAARRNTHPTDKTNPWLSTATMRREVQLNAPDGMGESDALVLAKSHLQRYSHPGSTGSITLSIDPKQDGRPFPRQAIAAGMSLGLVGLHGSEEPTMFHITESSYSGNTASLTVDSRFRDQLTVAEVRLRGADSLKPQRMLTTVDWQPNVPDLLFPWSYELGAGYIPFGSEKLFRGINNYEAFPWANWAKAHPPGKAEWRQMYLRIPWRTKNNSNYNWSAHTWDFIADPPAAPDVPPPVGVKSRTFAATPVLLSQAGASKLIEIAAFDMYGNILPVSFHFSLWNSNTVNGLAGPTIGTAAQRNAVNATVPGGGNYKIGQHNPFFPGAWSSVDENGVTQNPLTPQAESSASLIVGWGNYYERCGYWPNSSSTPGAKKTGLFREETPFEWNLTSVDGTFVNPQEPTEINFADLNRATIYAMAYCDDMPTNQGVYLLGRIYRSEPGVT
jgi:hypothetical protein